MVTLSLERACNLSKNEHYNWQTILTTIDSWTHINEGKSGFVSHTKLTAEATFMDLFHYD